MFRKQVNPKVAALATLLILAAIQGIYWRALVYREMKNMPMGGGGGGGGPAIPYAVGREDVDVETFAGEEPGYADGPGWQARFSGPNALALAPDGTLLVADSRNHRIRRVSPTGRVTTEAGGGEPGGSGGRADGPAAGARFRYPSGIAVATDGTIYVADTGNHRLCRIRQGQVSTLAGGTAGKADGSGPGARFRFPAALTLDSAGALWVTDVGNRTVRRVDTDGRVTTPAPPPAIAAALGDVGPAPAKRTVFASPGGHDEPEATDFFIGRESPGSGGAVRVFADPESHVLFVQRGKEPPLLVAGRLVHGRPQPGTTDGQGLRASFAAPCAAVLSAGGTVYVAEYEGNRIRRVRLPTWLSGGEPAPARPRFGRREASGR